MRGWRQGAGLPLWQPHALPTPEPFVLQGQSRISCGPEIPAEPPGGAGQACACPWHQAGTGRGGGGPWGSRAMLSVSPQENEEGGRVQTPASEPLWPVGPRLSSVSVCPCFSVSVSVSLSVCLSVSLSPPALSASPAGSSQGDLTRSDPPSARSLQGPTHCPHGNQTGGSTTLAPLSPALLPRTVLRGGLGCTGPLSKGRLGVAGRASGPLPARQQGLRGTAMCGLWAGPASRALPTQHCRWMQAPTAPAALGSSGTLGSGRPFTACMGLFGPTTRRARPASAGGRFARSCSAPRPPASSADPRLWVPGMG